MKRLLLATASTLLLSSSLALSAPLRVVTSFSILEDLTHNIGQKEVEITSIIGRNQEAHGFEPTPKDILTIQQADVIVLNGAGFDGWLNRILEANNYEGIVIDASRNVPLLSWEDEADAHHDHDHEDHHTAKETHATVEHQELSLIHI